jgi:hypothetical protein
MRPVESLRDTVRSVAFIVTVATAVTAAAPLAAEPAAPDPAIPDGVDWNALLFEATTLDRSAKPPALPKRKETPATTWSRVDKPDGSTALTVRRALPGAWDTRIGADFGYGGPAGDTPRPDRRLPGTVDDGRSTGAAWANMSTPGGASIESRFETMHDREKVGAKLSKSVPLGGNLSVTLQNGFAVTQPLPDAIAPAPTPGVIATAPAQAAPAGPSQVYSTERAARFNVAPTGTTFIAGASATTADRWASGLGKSDEKWLRTFGAEQKLFGARSPVTVSGAVSETDTGAYNKSLKAGVKLDW